MNLALLAVAVLCMSQPALLVRAAHAPNEAIGFWRLVTAVVLLSPFAWRKRSSWLNLSARDRKSVILAGMLFFIHLWMFVYATQHTRIADLMIAFSTHPVWTGAGAWLFFGERVTPRVVIAYVLAGAGVFALFSGAASGATDVWGDAAGLAAAISFSGYVLIGKGARRKLDNFVFAEIVSVVVCAGFFLAGSARGVNFIDYPPQFWACVVGLAVMTSLGGHALFSHLLAVMDVNLLSCAKLLEMPLAAVGAWAAFGEPFTARTITAFVLVATAVLILLLPKRGVKALPAEVEE